jgi:hypothetical protein
MEALRAIKGMSMQTTMAKLSPLKVTQRTTLANILYLPSQNRAGSVYPVLALPLLSSLMITPSRVRRSARIPLSLVVMMFLSVGKGDEVWLVAEDTHLHLPKFQVRMKQVPGVFCSGIFTHTSYLPLS